MNQEKYLSEIEELKKRVCSLELENSRGRFVNFFSRSFTRLNMIFGIGITIIVTSFVLYAAQVFFSEGDLIVADDVNANFSELYTGVDGLGNEVLETQSDINAINSSLMNLVPLGTILAWHKSMAGTPGLPEGWVECNGQTLDDDESLYDGQIVPDLNGDARFLRGTDTISGVMQAEETAKNSLNIESDTHYHRSPFYSYSNDGTITDNSLYLGDYGGNERRLMTSTNNYSAYAYRTTSDTHNHTFTGGEETRPVNMSVVWIIKVK